MSGESELDEEALKEKTQRGSRVDEAQKESSRDFADAVLDARQQLADGEVSRTLSLTGTEFVSILIAIEQMPSQVADVDDIPTPGTDGYSRSRMLKALVRRGLDDIDESLFEASKEAKKREIDREL